MERGIYRMKTMLKKLFQRLTSKEITPPPPKVGCKRKGRNMSVATR